MFTILEITLIQNSTTNKKDVKWQTTLRQFETSHNIRIPSNVAANKASGLRSLDLSYNQFTDDLAHELCSILYGNAPLSCKKLTSYNFMKTKLFSILLSSYACFIHYNFHKPIKKCSRVVDLMYL